MRKIRNLSFLGILVVVIAVLFLMSISINFTQAQVNIQGKGSTKVKPDKPGKPPKPDDPAEDEATWAVRIPTLDSGNMFYGVGDGYYEDNDPNIVVSVKKNSPGTWRRYFNFVYAFDFTITNEKFGTGASPANQVGFQGVDNLYDYVLPDPPLPLGIFPWAMDIATFLNNEHPYSGVETGEEDYQYFWFRIHMFDQDIESMGVGQTYLFGDGPDAGEPGDFLRMVARYRQDCFPEPLYHDVELYRSINRARALGLGNPRNIEIKRLDVSAYEAEFGIECEAVWRFWVLPVDYQGIDGFLKVKERYCTTERNKIKWYYPMEATGKFNFYIDWIKNPKTTD